jgi:putative phosphoribosyl transferase
MRYPMAARYRDRTDAGRHLAARLREYADRTDVIVLALPRGGVPVAYEVARALHAPLDVFVVRKLGLPAHPELAMGAIASGGIRVIDQEAVSRFGVTDEELAAIAAAEERELDRRERRYRDDLPSIDVAGKTVILIDDGLATGATMAAAVIALRAQRPARLVVAVPVSAPETCNELRDMVDDVVCAATPEPFYAVFLVVSSRALARWPMFRAWQRACAARSPGCRPGGRSAGWRRSPAAARRRAEWRPEDRARSA